MRGIASTGFGQLIAFAIVLAVVGFCFDYSLETYFGKDIPWYIDCVAGFVTSPISIPAAVIGSVLVHCDVSTPIFQFQE